MRLPIAISTLLVSAAKGAACLVSSPEKIREVQRLRSRALARLPCLPRLTGPDVPDDDREDARRGYPGCARGGAWVCGELSPDAQCSPTLFLLLLGDIMYRRADGFAAA